MRTKMAFLIVLVCLAAGSRPVSAGTIVVANDEWTLSNTGFGSASATSTVTFAQNVGSLFGGGGPGNFLVYSDNFGLDPDQATLLAATMTGAGHTWVDYSDVSGFTFDLATLMGYDAVFVALEPGADQNVLTSYVNAGGNVYLAAGTGARGSVGEAAAWNTFLNTFGLEYGTLYNGIGGDIPISSSHPVMSGVSTLFQNNGNSISLFGGNPNAQIIASFNQQGMYAVYSDVAAVPEPASLTLFGTGISLLIARRRRARNLTN